MMRITRPELYLATLFFGLTLAFTFLTTNMSSIFKFIGISSVILPYLWLAAPLTGLILQPIVGQLSDNTHTRFGKRRPYLIFWGTLAALSFCCMAFINQFYIILFLIWVISLSINGAIEALRALTGDITNERNRASAFALQAAFGGLGAALGSGLPYLVKRLYDLIHKSNIINPLTIPIDFKIAFFISGIVIIIILTIFLSKVKERKYKHFKSSPKYQHSYYFLNAFNLFFHSFINNVKKMPKKFRFLCLIQLITWAGIFIFWLYFPIVIAQNIYHLTPGADIIQDQQNAILFQKATLLASFYSSIYQYVSVIVCFSIFIFSSKLNLKWSYIFSLCCGACSLVILSIMNNFSFLLVGTVLFGLMWGGVVVLPSILALESLPKSRIGVYLGILNTSITFPQIICGLVLGPIYTYLFQQHANYLLLFASLFIICGIFLMWKEVTTPSLPLKSSFYKI